MLSNDIHAISHTHLLHLCHAEECKRTFSGTYVEFRGSESSVSQNLQHTFDAEPGSPDDHLLLAQTPKSSFAARGPKC